MHDWRDASSWVTLQEGCAVPKWFQQEQEPCQPMGHPTSRRQMPAVEDVLLHGGADGLSPDLQIPENRSKSLQSFPFYTYDSQAFASYISIAFPQS